jgi:succinyl-CoA synthetase beta subunit
VVIKAQVLSGGRGLAGGVVTAGTPEEVHLESTRLLGAEIKNMPVRSLMIVRKIDFVQELYLGITIDGYSGKPVVMVSTKGGMNIEEVSRKTPDAIATKRIDVDRGLFVFEARQLLTSAGIPSSFCTRIADVLIRLYQVFLEYKAIVAEINPLVVCTDNSLMAIDAKLDVDDSSLHRLGKKLPRNSDQDETILEKLGREIGVTYVDLDGEIGIISSGAGLGMATMDIIGQRLRPANFLETGGGITEDLLYKTMDLVMKKKGLKGIFINLYGGINPIHEGAAGVARYIKENDIKIPIVAKALGNREEETWEIFRSAGVHVVTHVSTEKAVDKLIEILQ